MGKYRMTFSLKPGIKQGCSLSLLSGSHRQCKKCRKKKKNDWRKESLLLFAGENDYVGNPKEFTQKLL